MGNVHRITYFQVHVNFSVLSNCYRCSYWKISKFVLVGNWANVGSSAFVFTLQDESVSYIKNECTNRSCKKLKKYSVFKIFARNEFAGI